MSLSFNREMALPSSRFLELSFRRARIKNFPPRFSFAFLSCRAHNFYATIILYKLRDRLSQPRLSSRSSLIGCFYFSPSLCSVDDPTPHASPHPRGPGLSSGSSSLWRILSKWPIHVNLGTTPYGRSCPGNDLLASTLASPRGRGVDLNVAASLRHIQSLHALHPATALMGVM